MTIEKRQYVPPFEDRQVTARYSRGIGSPFLAIEQRDLAERFARLWDREHDFPAVPRRHADAHATAQDCHHAVACRSHMENGLAGAIAANVNAGKQGITFFGAELAKQHALAQQLATILSRHSGRHSSGTLRRGILARPGHIASLR